ncbi:MAG: NAD(P)-binding domain-containing protein [Candidatus Micrarchaeaceae archaeon]|jgi:6-phosphogluconate dehydrogenase (decarboxylating)|nr:NAD(P)-binding domain-containing protein [Candidatus Micrarchaeota archaeon]HII09568.1 NAD(P)-binding domain-containing protein [Candidatus Micrarchaeota archaeon]
MATARKSIGVVGIGSMGHNIVKLLRDKGYSLVIYDRTSEKYSDYAADNGVYCAKDADDFVEKLRQQEGNAKVWMMLPGGAATNEFVSDISASLRRGDIVIDASNSMYEDSIANSRKLSDKGIYYLDVGCGGGPKDLLNGVSLMVGGEREAFEKAEDVFKTIAGNGTYGYVGGSGAGHMVKLVHNIIFYSIFPVVVEGTEMLLRMGEDRKGEIDMNEALRLLAASPPITTSITSAIAEAYTEGLPDGAPEITVSGMVSEGVKKAHALRINPGIIETVLSRYPYMSKKSREIYAAAKKIITSH